jgi:hypothetical protein
MGFVGGSGFWVGLWITGVLPAVNHISSESSFVLLRVVVTLSLMVVAASAVVHFIPSAAEDRSCHNIFRDGRRQISPVVELNLNVPQSEWRDVREFFRRFSAAHNLSFQDGEDISGVGLPDALMLDLCNDLGTNISVTGYHQAGDARDPIRGLPIGVYLFQNNRGWKGLAREFIDSAQQSWPGKVEFQDGSGNTISRPKILDQE